jgi:hypothetical protein
MLLDQNITSDSPRVLGLGRFPPNFTNHHHVPESSQLQVYKEARQALRTSWFSGVGHRGAQAYEPAIEDKRQGTLTEF